MRTPEPPDPERPASLDPTSFDPASFDPVQTLTVYIEDLKKTIALATTLTKAGRKVDLSGLEHSVGIVCAKALDLMPDQGRTLRPALVALAAALDALSIASRPD